MTSEAEFLCVYVHFQVHDAYIESADMLLKSNPLAAVDVYCRFPVAETPTFDDAYIFGEIVRILMKNEKYDDPRLAQNMISLGKVYGLGKVLQSLCPLFF